MSTMLSRNGSRQPHSRNCSPDRPLTDITAVGQEQTRRASRMRPGRMKPRLCVCAHSIASSTVRPTRRRRRALEEAQHRQQDSAPDADPS